MSRFNPFRFSGTILALVLSLAANIVNAQLAAGDILFTGIDAQPGVSTSGPRFDRASFVTLREIPQNTVIYFTDRGYKAGAWFVANGSTEGTLKLTVSTTITFGTEVLLVMTPESGGNNYYSATVGGVSIGSLVQQTSRLSLGNTGDQLFAYQSADGQPNSPGAVLLAGLNLNVYQTGTTNNYTLLSTDTGWDNLSTGTNPALNANNSDLPPGLVAGQSAFWLGYVLNSTTGYHNVVEAAAFNGIGKPYTTAEQIRSNLMNRNNWTRIGSGAGTAVTVPTMHFISTLPVTLSSFTAELDQGGKLVAKWKTLSEINNSHFILQSSADGKKWTDLLTKQASGNAAGTEYEAEAMIATLSMAGFGLFGLLLLPYSRKGYRLLTILACVALFAASCAKENRLGMGGIAIDPANNKNKAVYLRLTQVDLDGTTAYSEVLYVKAK